MIVNKKLLSAALLASSATFAGTMGPVAKSFDGLYLGLGTGFNSVFASDSFTTTRSNSLGGDSGTNRYTYTSVLFNGNIGYGKMVRERTYLGAKASIFYSPMVHTDETGFSTAVGNVLIVGNNSIKSNLKPFYNIDAVLGYEVAPSVLPFVEGGVSFANFSRSYTFKRSRTNINTPTNVKYQSVRHIDKYTTGFNVGIGIDYQPMKSWILGTELLYTYFGSNTRSVSVTIPGTTTVETQSRTFKSADVALFGTLSYLIDV